MYLSKVEIDNFRNFGSGFSLELQPYTVVVGANDVGKSNLIQAIQLVLGQGVYSSYRRQRLLQDDINFVAFENFRKSLINPKVPAKDIILPNIRISLYFEDLNDDQAAVAGNWSEDKELTSFGLHYKFEYGKTQEELIDWVNNFRETNKKNDGPDIIPSIPIDEYVFSITAGQGQIHPNIFDLNYFSIEVLDALRDAKRELVASSDNKLLYKILSADETEFTDILNKLQELKIEVDKDTHLKKVAQDVRQLLDDFSFEHEVKSTVGFLFSKIEKNEVLHKLSLQYGEKLLPLERNGLGRNNLLYMTLILSKLFKNYGIQSLFRLICIEEPEAHLHPEMIRQLAHSLKKQTGNGNDKRDDIQVLITSHSVDFTSSTELSSIVMIYVDEVSGQIKSHKLTSGLDIEKTKDKQTLDYLEKYLDATKSTLLFSRRTILVEGISEQILIPFLWRQEKEVDLTKYACSIINVQGISFEHFLKIMTAGYYVRTAVLTDSDTDKGNESNRIKNLKHYESEYVKVCVSSARTFELDLMNLNVSGDGAKIILEAVQLTKPDKFDEYSENNPTKFKPKVLYEIIKDNKAEFSMNVKTLLISSNKKLKVPQYITDGFNHIYADEKKREKQDESEISSSRSGSGEDNGLDHSSKS